MRSEFIVGLDLGQAQDYTAIVIAERLKLAVVAAPGEPPIEPAPSRGRQRYAIRHLERVKLGTTYPAIVAHVKELLAAPQLTGHTTMVVDRTGVGAGVVDLLRAAQLRPVCVTITGGNSVTRDEDGWHVPKRDLVAALTVALQSGRLKIAESLPHAHLLVQELLNFRQKINVSTVRDTYEAWREGDHDDLVLAAAMALWYAERGPGRPFAGDGWIHDSTNDDEE